jgi:hypothetical protein
MFAKYMITMPVAFYTISMNAFSYLGVKICFLSSTS